MYCERLFLQHVIQTVSKVRDRFQEQTDVMVLDQIPAARSMYLVCVPKPVQKMVFISSMSHLIAVSICN